MFDEDAYAEIAPFYDLEFDAFDADIELYLGYASMVGSPILELGCGTGRLLEPIANSGHQIIGIDNSPSMLEIARSRIESAGLTGQASVMCGSMLDLTAIDEHSMRLVIVAVNSFLHLETQDRQIEALRQIRRVLHRDGLLVLDVFNPTPETLSRMDERYAFDAEWTVERANVLQRYSYRQLDSAEQLITTRLFYDRIAEDGMVHRTSTSYRMRYVYRFELELLLKLAGFELEGIFGSYGLDPFERDSDVMIAVSHRTANTGED